MKGDSDGMPVQGRDTVEILSHDHEVIKEILERLTDATRRDGRRSVLERLKAALIIHNATEEIVVYPAVDKIAHDHDESEHLYHETAEADVVLFELDALLREGDAADFDVKANGFREQVLRHMENEERSAFPHLRQEMDSRKAKTLTDSVRSFRKSIHYDLT